MTAPAPAPAPAPDPDYITRQLGAAVVVELRRTPIDVEAAP